MVRKVVFFIVLAAYISLAYTHISAESETDSDTIRSPSKRQTIDQLSSAEIEQRRTVLEDQLRQLNQRRRHRYEKDRRCCERSLEVDDDTEESPCCQRLQKQKCPYREEKRCGVPEVRHVEVRKKVTKIVEVTAEPPENFLRLEQQRIHKLETDLRTLRQAEETRLYNTEEKRRLALEDELRRDLDDEEARLTALERNRRDALEEELRRLREAEKSRLRQLDSELKRDLEAKLEAEKRLEEDRRRQREIKLWADLEAQLGFDEEKVSGIERERRQTLDYDLQTERQNALALRKKRHDERRNQLEFELKELRKRDLDRLAELEEQRRREFEEELRKLKAVSDQRRQEIIEVDEVSYEPVPVEYESVKQQCCYRCAGQTCGDTGCDEEDEGCPLRKKKCDKCRCNHSFVSCPGNPGS